MYALVQEGRGKGLTSEQLRVGAGLSGNAQGERLLMPKSHPRPKKFAMLDDTPLCCSCLHVCPSSVKVRGRSQSV